MTGIQPTTRRERRIAARKEQILDAAARVFAEKGFLRATTKEIADAADLSEGSIYNYFESKHDLLLAIVDRVVRQALDRLLARLERLMSAEAYIAAVLQSHLDFIHQNQTFVKILGAEIWTDEELRERFMAQIIGPILDTGTRYLQNLVEEGKARVCRAEIVIPAVLGSLVVLAALRTQAAEHVMAGVSDDDLVEELARLYIYGLGPHAEAAG